MSKGTKMKKMILTAMVTCLFAGMAHADEASLSNEQGKRVLSIKGGSQGAGMEIFTILDKAGFQETQKVEITQISGKNIPATRSELNGADYNVVMTIDSNSVAAVEGKLVNLGGDPAEELTVAMEKAGYKPVRERGVSYVGQFVTCSELLVAEGPHPYSCTIQIR
jgi:hypothetical protein